MGGQAAGAAAAPVGMQRAADVAHLRVALSNADPPQYLRRPRGRRRSPHVLRLCRARGTGEQAGCWQHADVAGPHGTSQPWGQLCAGGPSHAPLHWGSCLPCCHAASRQAAVTARRGSLGSRQAQPRDCRGELRARAAAAAAPWVACYCENGASRQPSSATAAMAAAVPAAAGPARRLQRHEPQQHQQHQQQQQQQQQRTSQRTSRRTEASSPAPRARRPALQVAEWLGFSRLSASFGVMLTVKAACAGAGFRVILQYNDKLYALPFCDDDSDCGATQACQLFIVRPWGGGGGGTVGGGLLARAPAPVLLLPTHACKCVGVCAFVWWWVGVDGGGWGGGGGGGCVCVGGGGGAQPVFRLPTTSPKRHRCPRACLCNGLRPAAAAAAPIALVAAPQGRALSQTPPDHLRLSPRRLQCGARLPRGGPCTRSSQCQAGLKCGNDQGLLFCVQ